MYVLMQSTSYTLPNIFILFHYISVILRPIVWELWSEYLNQLYYYTLTKTRDYILLLTEIISAKILFRVQNNPGVQEKSVGKNWIILTLCMHIVKRKALSVKYFIYKILSRICISYILISWDSELWKQGFSFIRLFIFIRGFDEKIAC